MPNCFDSLIMSDINSGDVSTKMQKAAPLETASKPTLPVPAYKSQKTLPSISLPITLKSAPFKKSDEGETFFISNTLGIFLPYNEPAIIRIDKIYATRLNPPAFSCRV